MFSSFETLAIIQVGLIVQALWWYLRRNDEVPLIISVFMPYISSYRYWAVTQGIVKWTDISNFGFAPVEAGAALEALRLIVLGQTVLTLTYLACQKTRIVVSQMSLPLSFVRWLRPKVFGLSLASFPVVYVANAVTARKVEGGVSLGFEFSNYVILLPMMLVGIGCLLILLWRFGGLSMPEHRWLTLALLAEIFHLTFNPNMRFLFLGWIIAGAMIVTIGHTPKKRLAALAVALVVAVGLFTAAGAMRAQKQVDDEGLRATAWERTLGAHDANMLDGFVLLQQVYPAMLGFSHGQEHLDILTRPIPRSIWPDKPVGGYMNKLGIITTGTGFNLGISPSLFGSFYQEGGPWALVLISAIYGLLLAKLVAWTSRLHPFAGCLLRAMICAALIPLLRGGDLPGIYAWFGMSFWPGLLIVWLRRRELMPPAVAATPQRRRPRPELRTELTARSGNQPSTAFSGLETDFKPLQK